MADFDHITADGTTKYVKDSTARAGLADKVDKVAGKGLSEEDFTTTLKTKLDSIAAGAEVNVQSNWTEADATSDAYIQNKPTIPDDASEIDYDNTDSGLTATNVQEAIDEVVASGGSDPNKMDKADPTGTGKFTLNSRMNPSSAGDYSFVAGDNNDANGDYSVAMGHGCSVNGEAAQAFGLSSAFGDYSHAEGYTSAAGGNYSHAEGSATQANGESAHAEGTYTKASSAYQHVSGKYNVEDNADTYAEIIGNGTADNARSNARTLDWSGNEVIAGDLYFNGGVNPLSTQLAAKADPPSAITQDQTGSVELSHNAWKQIKTFSLSKGLYLIHVGVVFQGVNTTGIRAFTVTTTSAASGGGINTTRAPASSNDTNIHMTIPWEVTASSQTLYINAYQNAGTGVTLTAQPRFEYVKLR